MATKSKNFIHYKTMCKLDKRNTSSGLSYDDEIVRHINKLNDTIKDYCRSSKNFHNDFESLSQNLLSQIALSKTMMDLVTDDTLDITLSKFSSKLDTLLNLENDLETKVGKSNENLSNFLEKSKKIFNDMKELKAKRKTEKNYQTIPASSLFLEKEPKVSSSEHATRKRRKSIEKEKPILNEIETINSKVSSTTLLQRDSSAGKVIRNKKM
ncbi:MAG: hypothetical protein MJ252_13735, partial [archaeon]|nr:hypothetical protein [archaeon]